ncbi:stage II sporulation protein M [Aurantivibrio plasticivorans]
MRQQDFELQYTALWLDLEAWLSTSRWRWRKKKEQEPVSEEFIARVPEAYRLVCHHLALAKKRRYSPHLVDRLNRIVVGCHNRLYAGNPRFRYQWLRFFIIDFPRALHDNSLYVKWATILFLIPGIMLGVLCYFNPEMIYSVMSWDQVREMESMYDPSRRILGREREADTDLFMFGFYIYNNIGIAFREFAGGILLGVYTVFVLLFNGVILGAVTGHLTQLGYYETFYPFVIGHGSFELTAIVLAGAAGLKLGVSIISPGHFTRLGSLREASREAVKIVIGAGVMLLIAAFIEAFWSSKASTPVWVKLSVGAVLWALVLGYIKYMGRRASMMYARVTDGSE